MAEKGDLRVSFCIIEYVWPLCVLRVDYEITSVRNVLVIFVSRL